MIDNTLFLKGTSMICASNAIQKIKQQNWHDFSVSRETQPLLSKREEKWNINKMILLGAYGPLIIEGPLWTAFAVDSYAIDNFYTICFFFKENRRVACKMSVCWMAKSFVLYFCCVIRCSVLFNWANKKESDWNNSSCYHVQYNWYRIFRGVSRTMFFFLSILCRDNVCIWIGKTLSCFFAICVMCGYAW